MKRGAGRGTGLFENHYHQPSDEFHKSWNFKGLSKMAEFGYELGLAAAAQPALVEWVPGDEFETARKASFASALGPIRVFENLPSIRHVEYAPINYPPLARQTRTSGVVKRE